MKSLQVMTSATKCIFNFPFCISKCHSHQNKFTNNYEKNYFFWKNNFITILKKYKDLKTIVITGTNKPMQRPNCINDIIQIELQTRFDSLNEVFSKLDIVPQEISQNTFKVLHDSNGYNSKIDNWILKHSTSEKAFLKLKQDIEKYDGNLSIRLDENCMGSGNRYKVFREDGYLYDEFKIGTISKG